MKPTTRKRIPKTTNEDGSFIEIEIDGPKYIDRLKRTRTGSLLGICWELNLGDKNSTYHYIGETRMTMEDALKKINELYPNDYVWLMFNQDLWNKK